MRAPSGRGLPRVLFVDHAAALGGAELSLLDVARGYGGERAVVLFEDGPFRERLEQAGVPVEVMAAPPALLGVRAGGGGAADLRAVPAVAQLALGLARRARRFDAVVANSQKALVVAALAARLARRPLVWHLRDVLTADVFSPARRRLAVALANRAVARVIANSAATAEALVEAGGRAGRAVVVHNGMSPAPFDAVSDEAARRLRQSLRLGDGLLVGVFSRLAPWKGQHVLLDALALRSGLRALFVGGALFGGDGSYAAALRAQASELGLSDRVRFLGFRDDVPALMKACDVIAHTSVAPEPFGRVVVEGMLAGRPVVAADAGGVHEIVADGRTGLLVPPNDPAALATVLSAIGERPLWARAVAEAGATSARASFSVEGMVAGVEAAIHDVVAGHRLPVGSSS